MPLSVERLNAAKLQRQSIQTAEGGTAEPSTIWAGVKLHATIETVQRCDVVPMEKHHGVRSFDAHASVVFAPIFMIPDGCNHFRFDLSHS